MLNGWLFWLLIGVIASFLEIFIPGLLLLSLGIASLNATVSFFILPNIVVQVLIFISTFCVVRLFFKVNAEKMFELKLQGRNSKPIAGQIGIVTKVVGKKKKGYVLIGGEEYTAITAEESIQKQASVKIIGLYRGRVVVESLDR